MRKYTSCKKIGINSNTSSYYSKIKIHLQIIMYLNILLASYFFLLAIILHNL